MINRFNPSSSIVLLIFLISACSLGNKKKSGGIGEPNNTIMEAGMLEPGETYNMKIDTVGDVDWFALLVKAQGYVRISTKEVPEDLDLKVRFAHKQAWKSKKQKWITGQHSIPYTLTVHGPDTLYFVISDHYNKNASDENVIFKVDFIKEFDAYEPNDEADSAKMIKTGDIVKTAFFPKSDIDWFKTKVDTQGYLMVKAKSVPDNIGMQVRFARKEDEFSDVENIGGWHGVPAGIQVLDSGIIYFELSDNYNNDQSKEKAVWKVDYIPEMDTTEPNNSFEEAYPIKIGSSLGVAIFPKRDQDYFTFIPKESQTIRIAAKNHPDNITPEAKIYIEEDFEQKEVKGNTKLPFMFEVENGKKYYIRLHDNYDNDYSKEPFILKVFTPKKDKE